MKEFEFNFLEEYEKVFTSSASIIDICGGRGRGGSHFVTDLFLFKITRPMYFRGYFMRLIHSDIKGSLYQDFKDRIDENETIDYEDFHFNDNKMEVVYLPTGNKINSKGFKKSQGSQTAKLKSIAGATDVAIEECEETTEDDFNKLADSLRTVKADVRIYRVWNPPPKDHWLIKNYYELRPDTQYEDYYRFNSRGVRGHLSIFTTYKNNIQNINRDTIERFENYKYTNLDHYCRDILGLVSSGVKGQVYKDWESFKVLPDRNYYRLFGFDFGYTNDPSVLCELFVDGDRKEVYVYERFYRTHMRTSDIISECKGFNVEGDEVVCDNSEPNERAEMQLAGIMAIATKKGGKAGNKFKQINVVKGYRVYYHQDSKNINFESNNYKWAINPETKEPMNKPMDKDDHCLDAILYAINYYHRNYGSM